MSLVARSGGGVVIVSSEVEAFSVGNSGSPSPSPRPSPSFDRSSRLGSGSSGTKGTPFSKSVDWVVIVLDTYPMMSK